MTQWLFDTLVWTAALIGIVLLVRRPVARHFGAKAAYALWLLPFLRLILPPMVLPAWLAPRQSLTISEFTVTQTVGESTVSAFTPATPLIDWGLVVLAAWLLGATAFLFFRFRFYFEMRSQLLEQARPVGEAGDIRLVETPATDSPIAFGVLDKVVALPIGFMALTERTQRDLAIEHELAHHNARDLLANFMVQPLFALHWFNPLAWYGWRAMRRDQEAACDARVMANRDGQDRATYASIIANFAAGPDVALAAPMACPVIGEKSIIHRLRSLTMSDISPRRRTAGRLLMGAALLALPLTASISYAESLTVPNAPPAPVAPAAPTAPSASAVVPVPPAPPAPPMALTLQSAPDAPESEEAEKRVFVVREVEHDHEDGKQRKVIRHERKIHSEDGHKMSAEEREEMLAELREELDGLDKHFEVAMEDVRVAMIEMEKDGHTTSVRMECKGDKETNTWTDENGKQVVSICKSRIMAHALTGLKEARTAIAESTEMDSDMRKEVLAALDAKIADWKD